MHGIGNRILSLRQAVHAFQNKLELFVGDIETGRRLTHFERLRQFKYVCTSNGSV